MLLRCIAAATAYGIVQLRSYLVAYRSGNGDVALGVHSTFIEVGIRSTFFFRHILVGRWSNTIKTVLGVGLGHQLVSSRQCSHLTYRSKRQYATCFILFYPPHCCLMSAQQYLSLLLGSCYIISLSSFPIRSAY